MGGKEIIKCSEALYQHFIHCSLFLGNCFIVCGFMERY